MGLGSSVLEEPEMPPLPSFSFYVYICGMCTHVHVYAQCGYPCARRPEEEIGCFSLCLSTLSARGRVSH